MPFSVGKNGHVNEYRDVNEEIMNMLTCEENEEIDVNEDVDIHIKMVISMNIAM